MVPNPMVRARVYEAARQGGAKSYAQVAMEFGLAREEVCQYLALVQRIPTDLVARLEGGPALSLRKLLAIARLPTEDAKRRAFNALDR